MFLISRLFVTYCVACDESERVVNECFSGPQGFLRELERFHGRNPHLRKSSARRAGGGHSDNGKGEPVPPGWRYVRVSVFSRSFSPAPFQRTQMKMRHGQLLTTLRKIPFNFAHNPNIQERKTKSKLR